MSYEIFDQTLGHIVNEIDAYCPDEYALTDAIPWYGSYNEAESITSLLKQNTGHEFVIRRR